MAITIREIARICGVSRGTVDRALNGRGDVNPATRKRIIDTAEKLGYRPHFLARSLARGKTQSLGFVVFNLKNVYIAQFLEAAETRARELGYFSYITVTDKDQAVEMACLDHLAARQVDGIILLAVNTGPEFEEYLVRLGVPIVSVGNRVSPLFSHVGIDDKQAMVDSVNHVLARGYDTLFYVSPPLRYRGASNIDAAERRYAGFSEAVEKSSVRCVTHVIVNKEYDAIVTAARSASGRVAVICSSDIYALRILDFLNERGVRVPADVGLMGIDNIETLKHVRPALTTVDDQVEEMGRIAVQAIATQIDSGERSPNVTIAHRIIPGETVL